MSIEQPLDTRPLMLMGLKMTQRTITIVVTELPGHGYKLDVADTAVTAQEPSYEHALLSDALFKAARMLTAKATDLRGLRL